MTAWTFPAWQANTAYLASAVVTPVTVDGTVWRCVTAGTSGNTEPAWPTGSPWTVTDGTVTWWKGTTFRQDVNAGVQATILQPFATANPTLLRKVLTERPQSLATGELPLAWIDQMDETIVHANGVRQRQMGGLRICVADIAPDPEEYSDRANFVVDALLDWLTANFHAASATSIVEPVSVSESDYDEGGTHFTVTAIGCNAYVAEGRN